MDSSSNFKLLPLVNHTHVHRVHNAEVQLAAVEKRNKRASAGVGLHLCFCICDASLITLPRPLARA